MDKDGEPSNLVVDVAKAIANVQACSEADWWHFEAEAIAAVCAMMNFAENAKNEPVQNMHELDEAWALHQEAQRARKPEEARAALGGNTDEDE